MNSNFNFDLGIGSNGRSSKSLNDQKNKPTNNSYSYSSSTSSFSQPKTTPSWQPGKPSWTHQPAPSQPGLTRTELGGPASLVGDITGKSWNSTTPRPQQQKVAVASSIGIVNKNPNLFGDLVNSALGQNKIGGSNVPLNNATPSKNSNSFSMGGVANSLPKTSVGGGGVGGGYQSSGIGATVNAGPKMGSGSNKDPFGSFVDFSSSSKPMKNNAASNDFDFGGFQAAPKSNPLKFPTANSTPKMDSFGTQKPSSAPPVHSSAAADTFDVLFSSTTAANVAPSTGGGDQFSGGDEWGFDGGHDDRTTTTELDGLPPPPSGVSALTAKTKGLDNYKQGQYADAIKWLSWAEILLEKDGQSGASMEVLTCRASCYKEVGEYKKAVADCTKVLNHDEKNVAVLVQRALLYESMEKYRLGADDLRTVMKLDPGNRVARSTIHRLNKMAD